MEFALNLVQHVVGARADGGVVVGRHGDEVRDELERVHVAAGLDHVDDVARDASDVWRGRERVLEEEREVLLNDLRLNGVGVDVFVRRHVLEGLTRPLDLFVDFFVRCHGFRQIVAEVSQSLFAELLVLRLLSRS